MNPKRPDDGLASVALIEAQLTGKIIQCFFIVYNTLGCGFLESVYRKALAVELARQGLHVRQEMPIEVLYEGTPVGNFRLDLLVNDNVAVELKATELLAPVAKRQLINYLRASRLDVGLLLHFGAEAKFHRVVSPRVLTQAREEQIRPLPADR
jgi:GxxExxY protein